MSKEDKADFVDIELQPFTIQFTNQTYPHPTREEIAEKVYEYLQTTVFGYSEKRYNTDDREIMNKEPISAPLETFGDIESMLDRVEWPKTERTAAGLGSFVKTEQLGRVSKEQGGNRKQNQYNTERDPLNE